MKVFWYLATLILGLLGVLSLVRTIEVLALGRFLPMQLVIGAVGLVLAWLCLQKARAAGKAS